MIKYVLVFSILKKGDSMGGCCSPVMKLVAKISIFLSALAGICQGLMALGYDVLSMVKLQEHARIVGCIFGVAGVITLVMLIMWCMSHHCACGSSNCSCK